MTPRTTHNLAALALSVGVVAVSLAPAGEPLVAEPAPAGEVATGRNATVDAYIAGRVSTALALSESLAPYPMQVSVEDSIVRLSGVVGSEVLRDLAVEIAEGVENVRDVESHLQIDAAATPHGSEHGEFRGRFADATITARVKTRLLWNASTRDLGIAVETRGRVVELAGAVGSGAERELAGRIAGNTEGVRRVDNRLEVRAAE